MCSVARIGKFEPHVTELYALYGVNILFYVLNRKLVLELFLSDDVACSQSDLNHKTIALEARLFIM